MLAGLSSVPKRTGLSSSVQFMKKVTSPKKIAFAPVFSSAFTTRTFSIGSKSNFSSIPSSLLRLTEKRGTSQMLAPRKSLASIYSSSLLSSPASLCKIKQRDSNKKTIEHYYSTGKRRGDRREQENEENFLEGDEPLIEPQSSLQILGRSRREERDSRSSMPIPWDDYLGMSLEELKETYGVDLKETWSTKFVSPLESRDPKEIALLAKKEDMESIMPFRFKFSNYKYDYVPGFNKVLTPVCTLSSPFLLGKKLSSFRFFLSQAK